MQRANPVVLVVCASATFALTPGARAGSPLDGLIPSAGTPFSVPMSGSTSVEVLAAADLGGPPGVEVVYGEGTRIAVESLLGDTFLLPPDAIDLGETVLEIDAAGTVEGVSTFVVRTTDSLRLVTVSHSAGQWIINAQLFASGSFGDGKRDGVIVCDVTGDGIDDIVTFRQGQGQVRVYPGMGGGGFASAPLTSLVASGQLTSMTLVDLDGDGDKDFAGFSSPGGFYPLENTGDGFFQSFTSPAPPTTYGKDALGGVGHDFTGDGNADLAVITPFSALELWAGDGAGGFAPPIIIPTPTGAIACVLADLNNDGIADVVSVLHFNLVGVHYGTGESLSPPETLRTGNAAASAVPCDADGDGDTDLIITHMLFGALCGPTLLENSGAAGGYTLESIGAFELMAGSSMAVGDFDGNGFNDVFASTLSFTNHMSLNSGSAKLTPFADLKFFASFPALTPVQPADGDPRAFIAFRQSSPTRMGVLRYDPVVESLDVVATRSLPAEPLDLLAADMDSDGFEDVLVCYAGGSPAVSIVPQTPLGFGDPVAVNGSGGGKVLLAGDIDDDGHPDLALADDGVLRFARRTGPLAYSPFTTRAVPDLAEVRAAAIANVDKTGTADAVLVGRGVGASDFRLVVMPNFFTSGATTTIDLPALPTDVAAYDFDNDGDDDLAITLDRVGVADAIATLINDGGFSADRIALSLPGSLPASLVLADLHEPVQQRGAGVSRPAPEAIVLNTGPSFPGFAGVTVSVNLTDTREAPGALCPGDTNGDDVVNFLDLNAVLSAFGQSGAPGFSGADLDGNGVVNFLDLNAVLSAYGTSCG